MKEITTETGFYVLVDTDGVERSKADVTVGDHPVPDWVDLTQSYDVQSQDELDAISVTPKL